MSYFGDFRNLDRNDVGGWPKTVKYTFIVLLFVAIVLAGYYFKISDQRDDLATLQHKEMTLKKDFSQKQAKAANLEALKTQLDQMKDMLQVLLRQLPSKTEMPALLIDISQTALAAGIDNELFEPGREVPKEFYAEKPIKIRMIGTYHQFGAFISGVASLPRVVILTMHDVSLTPMKSGDRLLLQGTVKTYRYLDDDEDSSSTSKKKNNRGRK